MKTRHRYILNILIWVLLPAFGSIQAQDNPASQGLSVKLSPGVMSFYGEMTNNSLNPFDKLSNGSKFGIGAGVVKSFGPVFAIQAQFVAGSLYSVLGAPEDPGRTYFSGSITDFSLSARVDPLMINRSKTTRISPYLSFGVSTIGFRSVHRDYVTNQVLVPTFGYKIDGVTKSPRVTAMAIPVAIGISFILSPNLSIEVEHSLRFSNTDLLDCVKGETSINDKYSLTSVGLRYTFAAPSLPAGRQAETTTEPVKTRRSPKEQKSNKIKPSDAGKLPLTKQDYPVTDIFIDCEIPASILSNRIYEVNLRINKSGYNGPARLSQKYPPGFAAFESMESTAIFSFNNQEAVIDWDQMPLDSVITYRYYIRPGENVVGSQPVAGQFDYEQTDGPRTIRFNKLVFVENRLENQMDKKIEEYLGKDTDLNKQVKAKEETDIDTDIDRLLRQYGGDDDKAAAVKTGTGQIKPSKAIAGIEYRVQCGAFREKIPTVQKITSLYKITETLQEEIHEGWYKYTVGSFKTYEEAVRFRDNFIRSSGLRTAFIVAYRDGRRLARASDAFR